MRKLLHLYRLNFGNLIKMTEYVLKRVLGKTPTDAERELNEYYNQLIISDGFLKAEGSNYYASFFPEWKAQIKTRKWPSSDLSVFRQVFHDLEYKTLVETFTHYFSANAQLNIIDAGSNIGLTSLYLSRFFPNARFVCIEPDAGNFDVLSFNLQENRVEQFTPLRAGLWSRNTGLELVRDFSDGKDWFIRVQETQRPDGLEGFSVQHLVTQFGIDKIDILKIDIGGSEKEIFAGSHSDVSFLDITKCIAIEIHDEFDCRDAVYEKLATHGFTYFESGKLTIGVNQNLL